MRFLLIVSLALIMIVTPTYAATESEQPRYLPDGRLLDGAADWVSSNRDRLAFGSGQRVTIVTVRPSLRLEKVWNLDHPVTAGLVIGSDLYFVQQSDTGDELVVADLGAAIPSPRTIRLDPAPRGALRIAQMDDYLLVAEDGLGVRVLQLPGHQHAGHHERGAGGPTAIGVFAIEEPIHALGVSLRTIYLTTEEHLFEIHASPPSSPTLGRRIPLEEPVHALAANNDTVYLLSEDGLRTVELSQAGVAPSVELDSGVRGTSLWVLGREVYVASGAAGLQSFRDSSIRAATIFISVGDSFFSPPGAVNANVGDTVRWDKPGTIFSHNVFSCNALQAGCGGATSTESFTSGPFTTLAFSFTHTFNVAGNNPYVCQVHNLTMRGDIVVTGGGPAPPPGVADTVGALPQMRVSKLVPGGANLSVQFDTSCANAVNRDLIFGDSTNLPAVLGGIYTPPGSRCAIGVSPFIWNATPSAPAGDFLWWILVADDGVSIEGPWGLDAGGGDRRGPGINGSSNLCGNIDKSLTNTCGQ